MIELYNDPDAPRNEEEAILFRIINFVFDLIIFIVCPIVYSLTIAWCHIKDKVEELFL